MKLLLLLFFYPFFYSNAQAEIKKTLNGMGIIYPSTASSKDSKKNESFIKPLLLPNFTKSNLGFKQNKRQIGEKKEPEINLSLNNVFVNPNLDIIKRENDKFNHIDLGTLTLNGNYIIVKFRDFSTPDGDMIRILYNNDPIIYQVILEPEYKEVKINLIIGENNLEFLALNEGASSPNTAEFEIFDETGKLIFANQWNLLYGETGRVVIKKDK